MLALVALVIAGILALTIYFRPDLDQARRMLREFLEMARDTPYSLLIVLVIYIVSGYLMLSVMALNLLMAIVFGTVRGVLYGIAGSLLSAALMFATGRRMGDMFFRRFMGERLHKLDRKFSDSGMIGVTMLRFLPVAPFGAVNLAAGMSSVTFLNFIGGTFFALLPGAVAKGLVGGSLTELFLEPDRETAFYLAVGLALWLAILLASHAMAKRYRSRAGNS